MHTDEIRPVFRIGRRLHALPHLTCVKWLIALEALDRTAHIGPNADLMHGVPGEINSECFGHSFCIHRFARPFRKTKIATVYTNGDKV